MQMQPQVEMSDEVQLYLLRQDIQALRDDVASLRQDVMPVVQFYTRVQTLGWAGRILIWLVGALVAIAVGALAIARGLRP